MAGCVKMAFPSYLRLKFRFRHSSGFIQQAFSFSLHHQPLHQLRHIRVSDECLVRGAGDGDVGWADVEDDIRHFL